MQREGLRSDRLRMWWIDRHLLCRRHRRAMRRVGWIWTTTLANDCLVDRFLTVVAQRHTCPDCIERLTELKRLHAHLSHAQTAT